MIPWYPNWKGKTCVLVASGPSATTADLTRALEYKAPVLVINNSWKLAPWAEVLYACDGEWWRHNKGCPDFHGLKITGDIRIPDVYPDVCGVNLRKYVDQILVDEEGTIGWGSNSGFHALNLAIQFGSKDIVLVGYDMTLRMGHHWFGKHDKALNSPSEFNIKVWRKALDGVAPWLGSQGIRVRNCSAISELAAYPKQPFEEIFP